MNKLFIIGNGFDLAHGSKTRYEDFLLWYLKPAALRASENGCFEDDILSISQGDTSLLLYENWVNQSASVRELISMLEKKGYKLNPKSNLFGKILDDGVYRWVDIENTYYQELKLILKRYGADETPNELIDLNNTLDSLRDKLVKYLQENYSEITLDVESSSFYTILSQVDAYEGDISDVEEGGFVQPLVESNSLFVNFNYTPLVQQYFNEIPNTLLRFDLIQIHGSIENPESIVFGFGDELDDVYHEMERKNNNDYFKHIKSFKYFQDENYQKLMSFVDSDNFEVIVLGHSLGLSDRTMLAQIFEHENLEQVQLYYYGDKEQNDFTEKTYEISRHFSDKGRMRLKVVNFQDSKPMPQVELEESI